MQNTNTVSELTTEERARARVANSAALSAHAETIFSDWNNADEHTEWVATAPESDIIAWAQEVEQSA